MKKCLIVIFISVMLVGCGQAQKNADETTENMLKTETEVGEVETATEEEYPPNPDPEPLGEGSFTDKSEMQGLGNEVMYDNIKVEMEETTYKLGVEKIACNIINQNVGKGFWVYHIPLLEYKDNGEWVRLRYYTESMKLGLETPKWHYCANISPDDEVFDITKQHSTMGILFTKYVMDELKPGEYRLVLFVGPNKYYAEFTLEE